MLTAANFNAHFPPPRKTDAFHEWTAEAKSNLVSFLNKHFHLTPVQREKFQELTPENIKELNDAIDQAVKGKLRIMTKAAASDSKFNLKMHVDSHSFVIELNGR